jgi:hypothetical protein
MAAMKKNTGSCGLHLHYKNLLSPGNKIRDVEMQETGSLDFRYKKIKLFRDNFYVRAILKL